MGIRNIIDPLLQLKFILRKKNTVLVPFEKKKAADRYRGSHYNDQSKCIGCGNCATICMNNAIDMVDRDIEKEREQDTGLRPRVDYGRCCYCGLCVDVCPSGSMQFSNEYIQVEKTPDNFIYIPGIEREHLKNSISYSQDVSTKLQNPTRVPMNHLDPDKRIKSFAEEILGYNDMEARREAQRCMECGVCVAGCPDSMHIPEYISHIRDGDNPGAVKLMLDNNPMSEICGKVCTRHCEDMCVAGMDGDPVAIRWLKRFASERLFDFIDEMEITPRSDNGKRVAVIGAGPAGISAAYYLRLRGYEVTVFEQFDSIGGMAYVGIPRYRLPKESLKRQKQLLDYVGVKFQFNTQIGKDLPFDELRKQYDAVFLGTGLHKSRSLKVDGEDIPGVFQASEFLKRINLGEVIDVGSKVVVIGGGNVAIDAARVSRRLGAAVEIYYRRRQEDMPADREEIHDCEAEGIKIIPQRIPMKFEYEKEIKSFKYYCAPAKMVDEPGKIRPNPVMIEGEVFCIEDIDTIIVAIGQESDTEPFKSINIFNERKKIDTDENGMTKAEGVFAGGDTVNRKNDIISAVADAVKAVRGIDRYLSR